MAMTEYDLIRCKRKSIGIYVSDGKVTVKAPLKTPLRTVQEFVAQKQGWIQRKLTQQEGRKCKYSGVLDCRVFLLGGEPATCLPTDKKRLAFENKTLLVPYIHITNGAINADEKFKSALKKAYVKYAESYLSARLAHIAARVNKSYSEFSLTNAKTKWGSCDGKKGIKLNWRLVMLPVAVCDYVIIHELVHTVQHNHSRLFWNGVAELYPKYKEAIAWLKEAGVLTEYLR